MARALRVLLVLAVLTSPVEGADPFKALDLMRPQRRVAAPDFTVPGLTGRPLRLSDFQGKVVLLNFWATWCPPCKQDMPSMERLYRRYKDRGFTILAVSIDAGGPGAVAAFVEKLGLTFPIGLDTKSEVANRYTVRALPSTFLIDRERAIAALAMGPRDFDSPAAHAVVEALLR